MLESPGTLLRMVRTHHGLTLAQLGAELGVSHALVAYWEKNQRRIPVVALERFDSLIGAEGWLIGLLRAIGTPQAFSLVGPDGREVPQPRRHWEDSFPEAFGKVWHWIRPHRSGRVQGYGFSGPTGIRFEADMAAGGLFINSLSVEPYLTYHLLLSEPGWADSGLGHLPEWLGVPIKSGFQPHEILLANPNDPIVEDFAEELRRRDRGDPATLRLRLRAMIGPEIWDRLESAYRRGTKKPSPRTVELTRSHPGEPQPPATTEERRALHRRLRESRGLSQAEVADQVSTLLALDDPDAEPVNRYRIQNYEHGRTSRVRYLAALLDVVYGADGWSCNEPVPVRPTRSVSETPSVSETQSVCETPSVRETQPGSYQFDVPRFWVGPVCVIATRVDPGAEPAGTLTLTTGHNRIELDLDRSPFSVAFRHYRPEQPPVQATVPPGWQVEAALGVDPAALHINGTWPLTDREAIRRVFEAHLPYNLGLFGKTESDLDQALEIA